MVHDDTGVLPSLIAPEPNSVTVARWYRAALVSADGSGTQFDSAFGIKQRTGRFDALQAQDEWQRFDPLIASHPALPPPATAILYRADAFSFDASTARRAGDELHLACAEHVDVSRFAALRREARPRKIKPGVFS